MTPLESVEQTDEAGNKVVVEPSAPEFGEAYLLVTTAVSSVMISAFSAAMGIEKPQVDEAVEGWKRVRDGLSQRLRWISDILFTEKVLTKGLYVWLQIVIGTVCLVTWVIRPNVTPLVVKSIGSLSLTMFVAVATDATSP